MDDIDARLLSIRDLPLDPRLAGIDDAVLRGLAARMTPEISARGFMLIAGISLMIGLAGSLVPSQRPRAVAAMPLIASAELAPSTLLGGSE